MVRLWDATTNQPLRTLQGPTAVALVVAWAADSQSVASGSDDGTVRVWDARTGAQHTVVLSLRNNQGVAITADGHYRGAGGVDRELVYVVQTEKGQDTFAPEEFTRKYSWNNDASRVTLTAPDTARKR